MSDNHHPQSDDERGNPAHHLNFMRARIIMRGTDFSDFERVRDQVVDWDSWWQSWEALGDNYRRLAAGYEDRGWTASAGDALVRAGLAYHWAKSLAVEDDDRYRATASNSVETLAAGLRALDPSFERVEVAFDGSTIVGNLRRPAGVERPPLVFLVPGLESVKEEFPTWERHLLDRGLATLSVDGPGQGEGGYDLRIRYDYEAPVGAFLDALADRADLDLSRVGAAGISMGGYYVVRAAAFEPRIKAVLSNCGAWDMGEAVMKMDSIYQAKVRWNTGTTDLESARKAASQLQLDGVAQLVRQPTIVVYGAADALVDKTHGVRLAEALPNGELWMIDGGNHGVTNYAPQHLGPGADWMAQQLAQRS